MFCNAVDWLSMLSLELNGVGRDRLPFVRPRLRQRDILVRSVVATEG
jgi:hypothetical protein